MTIQTNIVENLDKQNISFALWACYCLHSGAPIFTVRCLVKKVNLRETCGTEDPISSIGEVRYPCSSTDRQICAKGMIIFLIRYGNFKSFSPILIGTTQPIALHCKT